MFYATRTWKRDCPALLKLRANSRKSLEIVEFKCEHNHTTTKEDFILYPEVRNKIPDPEVEKEVNLLLSAKVKPARIRILMRGCNAGFLDPRDLANRRYV
jgi:hypothetical protein